jgi:hypothetical protein
MVRESPTVALIFQDLEVVWRELVVVYNGDFRNLVYGVLPNPNEILATLTEIKKRLQTIKWTIKIDINL